MSRIYQIAGECMVSIKFGAHLASNAAPGTSSGALGSGTVAAAPNSSLYMLGLAEEAITITPHITHQPWLVSDYGPEVPFDILVNLAVCDINMTLVHFDRNVLDASVTESMGGAGFVGGAYDQFGGNLMGAGSPLGGNIPIGASGCRFMSLNIQTPNQPNYVWEFPATYMPQMPIKHPIGTKRSLTVCQWRSIPYNPTAIHSTSFSGSANLTITVPSEIMSSGATIITHELDSA